MEKEEHHPGRGKPAGGRRVDGKGQAFLTVVTKIQKKEKQKYKQIIGKTCSEKARGSIGAN